MIPEFYLCVCVSVRACVYSEVFLTQTLLKMSWNKNYAYGTTL